MSDQQDQELRLLHQALGIPEGWAQSRGWQRYYEPDSLIETEPDVFGRVQRLTPEAYTAWQQLRDAAAAQQLSLQLVSAFRSVAYQGDLLRRKLDAGRTIDDILSVNAVPGFSEHHSGRAIDITTPDCPVLEEAFESTAAFSWLLENAHHYGFHLSYPRDNALGMAYEPWHWCYVDKGSGKE